jgi:heme/copper-type cytochrome/quinol oxidase subunit 3
MKQRPAIDVSHLPLHAYGHHTTLWWGNVLMCVIEGTMFAIVVASYFYIRKAFPHWPPLNTPFPDLLPGTVNTVILLVSCAPMVWVHRLAVGGGSQRAIQAGVLICIALMLASIALRWFEFPRMFSQWDSNAYGSITWTALGLHLGHLLAATAEASVLAAWMFTHELDEKHRLDLNMLALYWYFVVGAWAILYPVLYFGPRLL